MKRSEIKVSKPEHTIIYAIGSGTVTNEKVWADPDNHWNARSYRPGYVLEVTSAGPLVLSANYHPDSKASREIKQASLLDASGYSLADYKARQEVLERASHWSEADRPNELKAELEALKKVPHGWKVDRIEPTHVRMLWAEYSQQLQERQDFRAFQQAQKDDKKQADKVAFGKVVDKLRELQVLDGKETMELIEKYQWRDRDRLELPIAKLEELLTHLKTTSKAKGSA
jgi:hypothetical protein